jgi:cell division protein FtsW
MRLSRSDKSLFAAWWFTVDRQLFAAVNLLLLTGVVLSLAASPAVALRRGLEAFHYVERHAVFALAGAAIVFLVSVLRPGQMKRLAIVILGVGLLLMGLVLRFGPEINGSQRWLALAGQQIQPSELMKPAFVVIVALLLAERARRNDMPALPIAFALLALVVALLAMQPDIGQALLLAGVFVALLFLAGEPLRRILLLVAVGAVAFALAYATLPHVKSRIDRFIDPEAGDSYQMDRARQSFMEGGLLGRGPGEGTIKSVLPDAHTDYVLAVVAEEYGVLTCLVLLGLYGFVVLRALLHVLEEPDRFVRMAVAGLAFLLALQVLINMGVNVGLLPAKGLTLPFISYGGSSMLGMSIAMGMLVALTRRRPGRSGLKSSQFLRTEAQIAAGRGSVKP